MQRGRADRGEGIPERKEMGKNSSTSSSIRKSNSCQKKLVEEKEY